MRGTVRSVGGTESPDLQEICRDRKVEEGPQHRTTDNLITARKIESRYSLVHGHCQAQGKALACETSVSQLLVTPFIITFFY